MQNLNKFLCRLKYKRRFSNLHGCTLKWFFRLLMLRFSEPIKIRVLCANLVKIHNYVVSKRSQTLN